MHIRKKVGLANLGEDMFPRHLFRHLDELEYNYKKMRNDARFKKELAGYLRTFAGRPTPMYYARTLTKYAGGARIYLKREDLLHGGAHKINNALGQALLAKRAWVKHAYLQRQVLDSTAWPLQWRVRY